MKRMQSTCVVVLRKKEIAHGGKFVVDVEFWRGEKG
jgi:hypothetical protein